MNIYCPNPDCPEVDVVKTLTIALLDGEHVACSECGTNAVDDAGAEVVGPRPADPPPVQESLEARVTALEEFNAELVGALMAVFDPANAATASSLRDLLPKE